MPSKKYSVKAENIKNWFIVLGLTVLFIGCFLLAVITPFSITLYDKIASADNINGVVENNLLINNDLYFEDKTGQGWIGNSQWWLGQSNSTGSITNHNVLTSSNTSGYVNIRQWLDGVDTDVDLTFRVQLTSHTGNWLVQIWNYQDKNGIPSQGYTTGWQSSDYLSATFRLDSQYSYFMFVIQCRNTITLDYAKLEYGTSFTGYVPNNYTNYGYNQGYSDGVNDTVVKYGYEAFDYLAYYLADPLNTRFSSGDYNDINELFSVGGFTYGISNFYLAGSTSVSTDFDYFGVADDLLLDSVHYMPGFKYVSNYDILGDILINMPWVEFPYSPTSQRQSLKVAFVGRDTGKIVFVDRYDSYHWFNNGLYSNYTLEGNTYNVFNISISISFDEPVDIYFLPEVYISSIILAEVVFPGTWNNFRVMYAAFGDSAYGAGYREGLSDGFINGANSVHTQAYYDDGYREGVDSVNLAEKEAIAKQEGLTQGRNEGWNSAERFYHVGQYSDGTRFDFQTLLFSVVDAPLQAGFKMFDFEILGYNMRDLLFSFLTIGIILFTIKKFVV